MPGKPRTTTDPADDRKPDVDPDPDGTELPDDPVEAIEETGEPSGGNFA